MKKGFTLIEVIMVIVVIGILSSIAVPRFTGIHSDAMELSDVLEKRAERINKAREDSKI